LGHTDDDAQGRQTKGDMRGPSRTTPSMRRFARNRNKKLVVCCFVATLDTAEAQQRPLSTPLG